MRRPVPESAGTASGFFFAGPADGFGSAVAEPFGSLVAAAGLGLGPWSACTASTATTASAPAVSPVTQAHEGRRAGNGTHLLGRRSSGPRNRRSDHPTASAPCAVPPDAVSSLPARPSTSCALD